MCATRVTYRNPDHGKRDGDNDSRLHPASIGGCPLLAEVQKKKPPR